MLLMSANEELQEHVHHAQDPFDKRVAASMAIIAALLAVVSVLGQHLQTEELLLQQESSDQWAFYQAKSIRRFVSQATRDTLGEVKASPQMVNKYEQEAARYKSDSDEIQREAAKLQTESRVSGRQSARVHFGEIFLEIAIVFASLAILTKRPMIFYGAILAGLVGVIISASAFMD